MMFQLPFTIEFSAVSETAANLLDNLWIQAGLLFILIWLGIIGLVFLVRFLLHRRHETGLAFRKNIFLAVMPKESAIKKGEQDKEQSIREIQEKIAVMESVFSNLGVLKAEKGLIPWLVGRGDTFALEIVVKESLIYFYLAAPSRYREYLEQQIHAQYPDAQIEEVADYNIFKPQGIIVGAHVDLKRNSLFPIKTYKKMDSDPLLALATALSKAHKDDGVAIQILLRPAKKGVTDFAVTVTREMQKGQSASEALGAKSWLKPLVAVFKTKPKQTETVEKARTLSPLEQETQKSIEEKTTKVWMSANIRVVASGDDYEEAKQYLDNVVNAFGQFNIYEYGNAFSVESPRRQSRLTRDFIHRIFKKRHEIFLNTEELASLFHFPLPQTEIPNIHWLLAKAAPPPVNMPTEGLFLGTVSYRGRTSDVYIKEADRRRHAYILGKSGSGKSWLIANMARQDIKNGHGVCVIDPHGDLIEDVLQGVPPERAEDVIIFDPSDLERPMGLNMLEVRGEEQKDFAVQEMIAIFYKLFPPEMIGPMFEHNMRNVMLTLMADPETNGTIAEIPRMFSDPAFQKSWVDKVTDPVVRAFWEKEMAKTSDFHKSEMLGYLISKVGRFVENEMMRNIIGQQKSAFDFRDVMDKKKILLVNLAKGKTGEVNSNLLGLIIVSKLQMAALSRADMPDAERNDFYLYIDEFQNFITDSIATILSEARKYRLNLIIGHQYIGQLSGGGGALGKGGDTKIRDAVFGNVGTMMVFRVGPEDAEFLAKEFAPVFNAYDLINIEKYHAYVKLLIDNAPSRPFSMKTPMLGKGDEKLATALKQLSRLKYGRAKELVEIEILERSQLGGASASQIVEKTL